MSGGCLGAMGVSWLITAQLGQPGPVGPLGFPVNMQMSLTQDPGLCALPAAVAMSECSQGSRTGNSGQSPPCRSQAQSLGTARPARTTARTQPGLAAARDLRS